MTTLEWIAALACLTLLAMVIEHRMSRREDKQASSVARPGPLLATPTSPTTNTTTLPRT